MKWLVAPVLLAVMLPAVAKTQMCFTKAGRDFGIDPLLLMAISIKESRLKANAVNSSNRNKTEDVCAMQINSSHYAELKEFKIDRARLLNDPCVCVYTGAYILARNFKQYGKNWNSVGMYNTGPNPKAIRQRYAYVKHVQNIYSLLIANRVSPEGWR